MSIAGDVVEVSLHGSGNVKIDYIDYGFPIDKLPLKVDDSVFSSSSSDKNSVYAENPNAS